MRNFYLKYPLRKLNLACRIAFDIWDLLSMKNKNPLQSVDKFVTE